MRQTLQWDRCDCCGGDLPTVDDDNASPALPQRLRYDGACPGSITDEALCGAYEGWSADRIARYAARHGARPSA